jgi:hypothetical protein
MGLVGKETGNPSEPPMKPPYLMGKTMGSGRFFLKPTQRTDRKLEDEGSELIVHMVAMRISQLLYTTNF